MDKYYNLIDNHSYEWAVPVTFVGVILLAAITGFFQGWKATLFFACFDIAAIIIGIFATQPILLLALKNAHIDAPIDVQKFVSEHPAIVPIIILAWIPALRIIATPLYFIFRKKFNKSMQQNIAIRKAQKRVAKSMTEMDETNEGKKRAIGSKFRGNLATRSIGLSIGAVVSIPIATLSANATTIFSGKTALSKGIDAMVLGTTFGQYKGISEYVKDIKDVVGTVRDGGVDVLEDIFSGNTDPSKNPDFKANLDKNHSQIQDLINSKSFPSILRAMKPENVKVEDIKKAFKTDPNDPNKVTLDEINPKFELSDSRFTEIRKTLAKDFSWDLTTEQWDAIKVSYFKVAP